MAYNFTPAWNQPYTPGSLFLGRDPYSKADVGIPSERHFLTCAGAGAGKGAALIIPNLKRWPASVICVDPGGGNVKETWMDRQAMGQRVHVFDPYGIAEVPDYLRSTFNPLSNLDPAVDSYVDQVRALADGLVLRHDPKHASWDNAACDILAGVIDTVVNYYDPTERSLSTVRQLLTMPPRVEIEEGADPPDDLQTLFLGMSKPHRHEMSRAAAAVGLPDIAKPNGYISNAVQNTNWLMSPPILRTLANSTFDFADLRTGECSIYLVLPPHRVVQHSRFLRLFVRLALEAMAEGGERNKRCLFILDEFFTLGRIDEIHKAAGLMRKNGVNLWPILQDLGQLISLYGKEGADTFFANSDAHIFFGNTDDTTLSYISRKLETIRPDEIGQPPDPVWNAAAKPGSIQEALNGFARMKAEKESNLYQHKMRMAGQPRLTPLEVRELVAKPDGHKVARSMIVFGKGGDVFNLELAPYFQPAPPPPPPPPIPDAITIGNNLRTLIADRPGFLPMLKLWVAFAILAIAVPTLSNPDLFRGAKADDMLRWSAAAVALVWLLWPILPAKPALPEQVIWTLAGLPLAALGFTALGRFEKMTTQSFFRTSPIEAGLFLTAVWFAAGIVLFLIASKWPVTTPAAPPPPRNPVIDNVVRWAKRRRTNGG